MLVQPYIGFESGWAPVGDIRGALRNSLALEPSIFPEEHFRTFPHSDAHQTIENISSIFIYQEGDALPWPNHLCAITTPIAPSEPGLEVSGF